MTAVAAAPTRGHVKVAEDRPLNIHQRMLAVMSDLADEPIKKGHAQDRSAVRYPFLRWDDLAPAVAKACVAHGIAFSVDMADYEITDGGMIRVTVVAEFTNVDNPEESLRRQWTGIANGVGRTPQAFQTAATFAVKYLLSKTFLAPGDDDEDSQPEAGTSEPATTLRPAPRPTTGGKPKVVHREKVVGDNGEVRGCPECGVGDLELVRWDNGGERIGCSNWKECKYRETVPQAAPYHDSTPIPFA